MCCANCCHHSAFLVSKRVYPIMDFILRFKSEERVAIRASHDPIVRDFVLILGDKRLMFIDCNTSSVVYVIGYMEQVGLIGAGRADEIIG